MGRLGLWSVAAAFTTVMALGTVPAPLWPLYALSPTRVTVAFAAMVAGVAFGLSFLGDWSDRFGRRPMVTFAVLTACAAAATMAVWPQFPGLLIGRVLTGIGSGVMASTASTYLTELARGAPVAATVSAAASLGGTALGPLVAGALAQWAPRPLLTPYVVFVALTALAAALVSRVPETVTPVAARGDRFLLRAGRRRVFAGAATLAFSAFAILGMFSSVGSLLVRGELHYEQPWVWALATFVVLCASAVVQFAFATQPSARLLTLGLPVTPAGFGLLIVALYHPSLPLYLAGSVLAGAGAGLLFKAAIAAAIDAAAPSARAGVLAAFFTIAYAGMGIPAVLLAVAIHQMPQREAIALFGVAIAAMSLLAAALQRAATRTLEPAT